MVWTPSRFSGERPGFVAGVNKRYAESTGTPIDPKIISIAESQAAARKARAEELTEAW